MPDREHHDAAGLGHGFKNQDAWHDGISGKMTLEEGLIDGDRIFVNLNAVSVVIFPFFVARFRNIIIAEIAVLKWRLSISPSTFFIVW